jgi:hypothetical protein
VLFAIKIHKTNFKISNFHENQEKDLKGQPLNLLGGCKFYEVHTPVNLPPECGQPIDMDGTGADINFK